MIDRRSCLRCRQRITTNLKIKEYKNLDLSGYSLGYLHDVLKHATDFYLNQMVEEMKLMRMEIKTLTIENDTVNKTIGRINGDPERRMEPERKMEPVGRTRRARNSGNSDNYNINYNNHDSNYYSGHRDDSFVEEESSHARPQRRRRAAQREPVPVQVDSSDSDLYVKNTSVRNSRSNQRPHGAETPTRPRVEQSQERINRTKAPKGTKILPEDIKNTRKAILSNLIKNTKITAPSESEAKEGMELPRYNKFDDEES